MEFTLSDGIVIFVLGIFLTIIGYVIKWGISQIVAGQTATNNSLTEIKDEISGVKSEMAEVRVWRQMHEQSNLDYFNRSSQDRADIWRTMDDLRKYVNDLRDDFQTHKH